MGQAGSTEQFACVYSTPGLSFPAPPLHPGLGGLGRLLPHTPLPPWFSGLPQDQRKELVDHKTTERVPKKTLTATGCFSSNVWDKGETNWWMWWLICLNPTFCELWKPVVPLSHSLAPQPPKDFSAGGKLSSFLSFWMRLKKANPLTNLRSMVRLEKINIYWYICVFMDFFADWVSVPASWGTCGGQGTRSKSCPSPPTI